MSDLSFLARDLQSATAAAQHATLERDRLATALSTLLLPRLVALLDELGLPLLVEPLCVRHDEEGLAFTVALVSARPETLADEALPGPAARVEPVPATEPTSPVLPVITPVITPVIVPVITPVIAPVVVPVVVLAPRPIPIPTNVPVAREAGVGALPDWMSPPPPPRVPVAVLPAPDRADAPPPVPRPETDVTTATVAAQPVTPPVAASPAEPTQPGNEGIMSPWGDETELQARTPAAENPFAAPITDMPARAQILARAMASDLAMMRPEWMAQAAMAQDDDLRALWGSDVASARKDYVRQVGDEVAASTRFFEQALNQELATGRRIFG